MSIKFNFKASVTTSVSELIIRVRAVINSYNTEIGDAQYFWNPSMTDLKFASNNAGILSPGMMFTFQITPNDGADLASTEDLENCLQDNLADLGDCYAK